MLYALDFETHRIGPGAVAPRVVCGSIAHRPAPDAPVEVELLAVPDGLRDVLEALLTDPDARGVTHGGAFDYACAVATWPDLFPVVFDAMWSGRLTDTLWREKLLNLSTTGRLQAVPLPDGSTQSISYSLASLERAYLGRDRTDQKEDLETSWRANYAALDGWPADEYPEDAARYACEDAEGTLLVYEAQEARKRSWQTASTATEELRLRTSFCLMLATAWGMEVDPERVADMRRRVDQVLREVDPVLQRAKVLRPSRPPRPNAQQTKALAKALERLGASPPADGDWSDLRPALEVEGVKFTAGTKGSIDEKALQRVAAAAYRRLGQIPEMTAGRVDKKTGERVPQIKLGAEETALLATVDPIMEAYHTRKAYRKLITNQLPVLESAPVIHFAFDALVETGRTSSFGTDLYPSTNGQNVPKEIERIDPRRCYRPRAGRVLFDVDLEGLELACVGQVTHDLFGESVHFDRYNAGVNMHSYLGAQMLREFAQDGIDREVARALPSDHMAAYQVFMALRDCDEAVQGVYKRWRTLAKPIGLGFPGGMGPAKMTELARKDYQVEMTEEQAARFRELWRATYPEMPRYFDWVNGQVDQFNVDQHGESLYWYESRLGLVRRGATFCSVANGKAMQTPGAEAATAGWNDVVRACYDPSQGSVLYGCRPIAFVHDQCIGEVGPDPALWHDQCMAVSRLMCEASAVALPDMRMRSEALLTEVWSKSAVPTYDGSGRLIPWRPEE